MFYCAELLSRPNRGKLAQFWFAATMSERIFKKMYKSNVIIGTDVAAVCEEIMCTVEIRNEKTYGRFSLYLSTQLMYGTMKVFYYQVVLFEAHLRDIKKQLERHVVEKRVNLEFEANGAATILDAPTTDNFQDLELAQDLHLLRDEPYTLAVESLMKDAECLNFGVLTNEEVDILLSTNGEISLERLERLHMTGAETSTSVPSVDLQPQVWPETPRKRPASSPPAATPSKRKKVADEVSIQVPEPAPEEEPMQGVEQMHVEEQRSEELRREEEVQRQEEEEVQVAFTRRRGKKFSDRNTQLTRSTIRNWLSNVRIQTRELPYNQRTQEIGSARILLQQPCTVYRGVRMVLWARNLHRQFAGNIRGPFSTRNEFSAELTLPSVEELRQDTLREQTAELSSRLGHHTEIQESKLLESTAQLLLPQESGPVPEEELPFIGVQLPEITADQETIEVKTAHKRQEESDDWLRPLIVDRESKKEKYKSPSISPSSSVGVNVTKQDLLASLEVCWRDQEMLKFNDLLPVSNYDQVDAASVFLYLLECHTEEKLILKQAEPYYDIWIEKYPRYSSSESIDH